MTLHELKIENADNMTPEQASAFWLSFGEKLGADDGAAAREHLAAGRPIYYCEETTPDGLCIKEFPNGRRELVRFDLDGEHVIDSI
jgi:hypothetical protein